MNNGIAPPHTVAEIAAFLRKRFEPDEFIELRIPKVDGKERNTKSFFRKARDAAGLVNDAGKFHGRAKGIYVTLNPVRLPLVSNKWSANDTDIAGRHTLLVDCDPIRPDNLPADISATDEEKARAREVNDAIRDALRARGFPEPIVIDSGNGYHSLYHIDLPADDQIRTEDVPGGKPRTVKVDGPSTILVKAVLEALSYQFGTDRVDVDTTVFNASRIAKLPGTLAAKGEPTEERPHRYSSILETPESWDVVPVELLTALVAEWSPPPEPTPEPTPTPTTNGRKPRPGEWTPVRRFLAYLATIPPAISGQRGHNKLFKACCKAVEFGLSYDEIFRLIKQHYNPICQPPWSDEEIAHKVTDALEEAEAGKKLRVDRNGASHQHPKPRGYATDEASASAPPPPDLAAIRARLAPHIASKDAAAILRDAPLLADLARVRATSPTEFAAVVADLKRAKITGFNVRDFTAAVQEHEPKKKPTHDRTEFELSDLGNARRLVHHHGPSILFCHDWKYWLTYAAGRWNRDRSGAVQGMAKMVSKYVLLEMPPTADQDAVDAFKKWAHDSQSCKRIRDLMELARSDVPILPEQLDADPWSFNMLNGTLDLRTGELRPHDSRDLCTKQAPVNFDPTATAPRFQQFEREIFNGDEALIHYVRRKIGYAMTGDDSVQEMDIWHGEGSNGKNLYADTVRALLGDYAGHAESSLLLQKRTDDHPTGVADLQGKRFVTASETDDGRRIAEALVKQLTGDAVIKARKMHENFSEFARTFKLFLCTNHKPVIKGTDHAIWRRIRLVPFGVKFVKKGEPTAPPLILEEDTRLKETLIAEGSGIINLLLAACLDWQKNGMRPPEAVKAATDEFKGEMDTVTGFLAECCKSHLDNDDLRDKARVHKNELFEAYTEWCKDNRLAGLTPRKFGADLGKRGYRLDSSSGQYYRYGISLIKERSDDRGGAYGPAGYAVPPTFDGMPLNATTGADEQDADDLIDWSLSAGDEEAESA